MLAVFLSHCHFCFCNLASALSLLVCVAEPVSRAGSFSSFFLYCSTPLLTTSPSLDHDSSHLLSLCSLSRCSVKGLGREKKGVVVVCCRFFESLFCPVLVAALPSRHDGRTCKSGTLLCCLAPPGRPLPSEQLTVSAVFCHCLLPSPSPPLPFFFCSLDQCIFVVVGGGGDLLTFVTLCRC